MNPETKRRLIAVSAVVVMIASCCWIYLTQVCAARHNVGLHKRVGEAMAEESARLLGKKGRIVLLSIDPRDWPELKTQLDAFKETLKKLGQYDLKQYDLDTKDQPKYGLGSGLSGRRYVRLARKCENADLLVSFIGAPKLSKEEIAELGRKPRFIAESRSGDNLPALFENKLIDVAVVSRFQFPAPGPEHPKTPQEWFAKRYQIITATSGDVLAPAAKP